MKIYFASDTHLGAPTLADPRAHELRFVSWLDRIKADANEVYLLGDIFDYWYEYRSVVPRGFVRTLGKLSEMTDAGIKVHIFNGNHDTWIGNYLADECGLIVHHGHYEFSANGKQFFVGHGDDLGYDKSYHRLMLLFNSKTAQFFYSWLHPNIANWIAKTWSKNSRNSKKKEKYLHFLGDDREHQILFAKQFLQQGHDINYFIFGHRHIVADRQVSPSSRVLIIGEWVEKPTFAEFDGTNVAIKDVDSFLECKKNTN